MGETWGRGCSKYYGKGVKTLLSYYANASELSSAESHPKPRSVYPFSSIYSKVSREQHNKGNIPAISSNVFFSNVHETKKEWVPKTNYRPVVFKQAPDHSEVQDGDYSFHCQEHRRSRMGLYGGHYGRFSSCPNPLGFPQVLRVRDREREEHESVCVPVHALRPLNSSVAVYASHTPRKEIYQGLADSTSYVLRRFPNNGKFVRHSGHGDSKSNVYIDRSRVHDQQGEVGSQSSTDSGVSRGPIEPSRADTLFARRESFEHLRKLPDRMPKDILLPQVSGSVSRPSQFRVGLHPVRQAPPPSRYKVDEQVLLPLYKGLSNSGYRPAEDGSRNLAGSNLLEGISPNEPTSANTRDHDRRVINRLVRSSSPQPSLGPVASNVQPPSHQLVRTDGHSSDIGVFPTRDKGPHISSLVRQHHSVMVHSEARVTQDFVPPESHGRDIGAVPLPSGNANSETPAGSVERPCGSGLQIDTGRVGMGLGQHHIQLGSGSVSHISPGGPLCHQGQCSVEGVRISMPGRPGVRNGREINELEQVGLDLPVSPKETSARSPAAPQGLYRSGGSHSTLSGGIHNFAFTQTDLSWVSQIATPRIEPTHGKGGSGSRRSRIVETSRMDSMMNVYRAQGFSSQTLNTWAQHHAVSTINTYQHSWAMFLEYLSVQGIEHSKVRESDVYNFLQTHLESRKAHRTLLKYRAAFIQPFKVCFNIDLNTDFAGQFARASERINPPVVSAPMPTWTLDVLFSFLNGPQFEPLEECDMRHLKWKTLALIFVATGRRASGIANLSRDSFKWGDDGFLYLKWVKSFRPKNFLLVERANVKRRAKGLPVPPNCPSIFPLVVGSQGNNLLCPVRAYNIYIKRTSGEGFSDLFLWYHGKNKGKVNVQSISAIFSNLVRQAKRSAGIMNNDPIGPHQCRKLAASYGALLCNSERDENRLRERMGFSALSVLRKVYIRDVPPLTHAFVTPGGIYTPGKARSRFYRANRRGSKRGRGRGRGR